MTITTAIRITQILTAIIIITGIAGAAQVIISVIRLAETIAITVIIIVQTITTTAEVPAHLVQALPEEVQAHPALAAAHLSEGSKLFTAP